MIDDGLSWDTAAAFDREADRLRMQWTRSQIVELYEASRRRRFWSVVALTPVAVGLMFGSILA